MGVLSEVASKVLVVNAGSSSLKFKLFEASTWRPIIGGLVDRIGDITHSKVVLKDASGPATLRAPIPDHIGGMELMLGLLTDRISCTITKEVRAVGHRVVHGLEISKPVLLTNEVVNHIRKAAQLAPLHNPPGLSGIQAAMQVFGGSVPQVGVFDTAFHQTMPAHAYMYALPYDLYEKYHVRKYGFHGTSYKYLVEEASNVLNKPLAATNIIACHLGNGSSMAAIRNGKCIDTTMGMTPLEGLMMGTRCGDLDPAVVLYLQSKAGLSVAECDSLLNKKSGVFGIAGNNDLRNIIERRAAGDRLANLAMDMLVYRIRKYIGSYMMALEGNVDALVFSAGIGENSSLIRGLICQNLKAMGIELDEGRNQKTVDGQQGEISSDGSKLKVLVIPTDEELSIAKQTMDVVLEAGQ